MYLVNLCISVPYRHIDDTRSVISALKPPTPPLVSLTRDTCNTGNLLNLRRLPLPLRADTRILLFIRFE